MMETVTITCGDEKVIVSLTPEEVEVVKDALWQRQERDPNLDWTMADVIAYCVLWRGIESIKTNPQLLEQPGVQETK